MRVRRTLWCARPALSFVGLSRTAPYLATSLADSSGARLVKSDAVCSGASDKSKALATCVWGVCVGAWERGYVGAWVRGCGYRERGAHVSRRRSTIVNSSEQRQTDRPDLHQGIGTRVLPRGSAAAAPGQRRWGVQPIECLLLGGQRASNKSRAS